MKLDAMKLEHLGKCPLCRATGRTLLYDDLEDEVHRAVPGRFTLWICDGCHVAYLDPRPDEASIALAYAGYQTHTPALDQFAEPPSLLGRFRRSARNGYINLRYGYRVKPASLLGAIIVANLPPLRLAIDRWVARFRRKKGARLLDVGCGNGAWLRQMQALGWITEGVDFDPLAVKEAQALGLDVRLGGIEAASPGPFAAIALNHVLEHVHDPLALLKACEARLAPKGRLFIATPNLKSFGHARFGKHWRGLEAPRHLYVFTADRLRSLCVEAGLRPRGPMRTRAWAGEHFLASAALAKDARSQAVAAALADFGGMLMPALSEELVFVCRPLRKRQRAAPSIAASQSAVDARKE
ncbi:MAG: class I SAM-dependent methyltransferase [Deltaproteobacteria bacterium]|nr:class I SAM-dependent methyltransferase [Deltaproteobacteria bacterium]